MTEFEKVMLKNLQDGFSPEEITTEFHRYLANAQAEMERLHKEEEEKKRKEEEKKVLNQKENDAKHITELANRALTENTIPEDISWLWNRYMKQKGIKSEWTLNSADVDDVIYMMTKIVEPFIETINFTKSEESLQNKSDEEIIREFLNRTLR